MDNKIINIRITGLGGMGVLTASEILAEVLFRQNFDVKKAAVHGMSQRGGSIYSDVRFGKYVLSPMIPSGEVHYLVLFVKEEYGLYKNSCNDSAVVISDKFIDLKKIQNKKNLNIAMLGVLNSFLKIPYNAWLSVFEQLLRAEYLSINKAAFELGQQSAKV
jgi:indolepyruvate ferredoxin oxidoreductase, beta subunit